MFIRDATLEDAQQIQKLIFESVGNFPHVDFTESGWQYFLLVNDHEHIVNRLVEEQIVTLCLFDNAKTNNKLIGMLAVYNGEKIDQLFTHPDFQRQGVATQLWQEYLNRYAVEIDKLWVKSSSAAVPVYQSFGFELVSKKLFENGVGYFLMSKK